MIRYIVVSLFLIGCTTPANEFEPINIHYMDGPNFEWVEPIVFQHNMKICRSQPVCRAEDLFDG